MTSCCSALGRRGRNAAPQCARRSRPGNLRQASRKPIGTLREQKPTVGLTINDHLLQERHRELAGSCAALDCDANPIHVTITNMHGR